MRHLIISATLLILTCATSIARTESGPFLNPALPVEQRVADLLGRMTTEEKVGQLLCPLGWPMYTISPDRTTVAPSDSFCSLIEKTGAGMLWATFRADPWTRKTIANGLTPRLAAMAANVMQRYVINNTRLGIPMFFAEEAPHGHMAIGATVFPTGIGMAATWNPDLVTRVGKIIGAEVRSQGAHISYGPVLDLSRDPRWSRVEETYGEDPILAGRIGAAMVQGLGGGNLADPNATVATLKHFLAYAVPEGGQNGNFATVGTRDLLQNFLPPFHDAVNAGALSIMTSYNSIDGVPCTANSDLLTNVLTDQWHFRGFTVSDLYSIEGLCETHHIVPTMTDAAIMALEAGVDVDLGGDAFRNLVDACKSGRVSINALNRAVSRVLSLKFQMGLFENPYVDPDHADATVNNSLAKATALEAARQSVTLLRNVNSTLPLDPEKIHIAVVGPNAHNVYNQLGDYTAPQPDGNVSTLLNGLRSYIPDSRLTYVKGCAIRDTASSQIDLAVKAAQRADVIIAVVGGSSARDFKTEYLETGAAIVSDTSLSDMESGEGYDRASLSLMGHQSRLLAALRSTRKPLVVVYIEGRPLDKNWATDNADALLTAYYPGQAGGQAIADVIFGQYNPAGRLPFTVPRSEGQIPLYYNRRAPQLHDYVDLSCSPLFPFGFGLSYTSFAYNHLSVIYSPQGIPEALRITLSNIGPRDGDEVVQVYLRPHTAATVQPLMQLHSFARVHLRHGETRRITLPLTPADFTIIGVDYKPTLQSGTWDIMVGASSADIKLAETCTIP